MTIDVLKKRSLAFYSFLYYINKLLPRFLFCLDKIATGSSFILFNVYLILTLTSSEGPGSNPPFV